MSKNLQNCQDLLIPKDRIKSRKRVIAIALSASISAIMFGYSLKEITCIPIETIQTNYGTNMDKLMLQGLLIAIMPFGGLFGSLLCTVLLKKITRIQGMHIMVPLLALSVLLVQITTPLTLFVGRFLQGLCIGYYVSVTPIYLNEMTPKQMRPLTGTFFGLGKIVGVLLVIILELILGQGSWRFLLSFTVVLAVLQSILLFLIGVDTPLEWIFRRNKEKALESIKQIYIQEKVDQVVDDYQADFRLEESLIASKNSLSLASQEEQIFERKKSTAYKTCINVCIIRHFAGSNSLITSAGIIMTKFDKDLGHWTPLLVNFIQLIALSCFIIFFFNSFGRRQQLVTATGLLTIINIILTLSLLIGNAIMILLSIIAFMIVFGGLLLSVVWSYPSQIVPAAESLIPNCLHWLALSISTMAPSFVMEIMPNNQVYPCFYFFACYCMFAFIQFYLQAVQSNGLTYHDIIKKFDD